MAAIVAPLGDCNILDRHLPAPSGLIGIESVPRNVESYAGRLAGIGPLAVFRGRYI
jgi:hypothetical protein